MTKGIELKDDETEFLTKLILARAKELSKYTEDDKAVEELTEALGIKVRNILDRVARKSSEKSYKKGRNDGYFDCECW